MDPEKLIAEYLQAKYGEQEEVLVSREALLQILLLTGKATQKNAEDFVARCEALGAMVPVGDKLVGIAKGG